MAPVQKPMTSTTNSTSTSSSLPDPSQFQFLSYFQTFLNSFDTQEINVSNIAPLIFELETKFQTALSYVESLPDKAISLEEQKLKVNNLRQDLELKRESFKKYQLLLSENLKFSCTEDTKMET